VLGDVRLARPDDAEDVVHAPLAAVKGVEDAQPRRVGHRLQPRGDVVDEPLPCRGSWTALHSYNQMRIYAQLVGCQGTPPGAGTYVHPAVSPAGCLRVSSWAVALRRRRVRRRHQPREVERMPRAPRRRRQPTRPPAGTPFRVLLERRAEGLVDGGGTWGGRRRAVGPVAQDADADVAELVRLHQPASRQRLEEDGGQRVEVAPASEVLAEELLRDMYAGVPTTAPSASGARRGASTWRGRSRGSSPRIRRRSERGRGSRA